MANIRRPAASGALLSELGAPLDIRRPRFGDPLPETMADHSGAVFFGGPMSVNDEEDWLKREIDWIGSPLKENKPFLGICLGAQLLARHLGQKVDVHPEGKVEVGYYPIHPTEAGRFASATPFPDRVYQWHREGFDCPTGAVLLAEGEDFEAQAIKVGDKAFGLQFHPDVTYDMICRWTVDRAGPHGPARRPEARSTTSTAGSSTTAPSRAGRSNFCGVGSGSRTSTDRWRRPSDPVGKLSRGLASARRL